LRLPGVRLRHFTTPTPVVDVGLAYHGRRVPPVVQRLLATLDGLVRMRRDLGQRGASSCGPHSASHSP